SKDVLTIINMFKENKGRTYTNIKSRNYKTLQNLMGSLISMNKAEAWYVKNEEDKPMAGAFFLIFEGRIIFLFTGSTEEARNKKAIYFLLNSIIEEYSGQNII